MAKIAVVGVGAIGSVAAALLERTGRHEVVLCVRRPLARLVVESAEGVHEVAAARLGDPAAAAPVDWVLIATKAYDADGASAWLGSLAAAGANVAILQNGVEHRERFRKWIPDTRLIPVVVDCPVERPEPGRVRQRGVMQLKVPAGDSGKAFVGLFAGSPAKAEELADFATAAWRKLCFNAAGVLCALTRQPAGVFRDSHVAEAARQIVREAIAVGRAEGAVLPDTLPDEVVAATCAQAPDSVNSLLADLLADRPIEIDARNGVIVRLGSRHGVATPANQLAVALLGPRAAPVGTVKAK